MKILLYTLSIWFVLLNKLLTAGTIDPATPDHKYIEYGSKFHCILHLCGIYEDNKLFCASAVALKPNWIITAAHVVNGSKECFITIGDKVYKLKNITCHPLYNENQFGEYDLALCYSEKNSELDFYPDLYEIRDEVVNVCSISGFGIAGTFKTGVITSDGKRRAGSNVIDNIEKKLLICTPSITQKTELEFLIGNGDSGGGLFIGNKLAGINSCVMASDGKPDSTYYDEGGHTRISEYVEWIKEKINEK